MNISIVRIAIDKQSCWDATGKRYTIKDIRKNPDWYNVYVRKSTRNNSNTIAYGYIIAKKPNKWAKAISIESSPSQVNTAGNGIIPKGVPRPTIVGYQAGSNKAISISIVLEDKGSAYEIIDRIVKYFSQINKMNINCEYIKACGCGNIANILSCCIEHNTKTRCLVIYDFGVSDANINTVKIIRDTINLLNVHKAGKYIGVRPTCMEEMLLTFKGLERDIKNLSEEHRKILKKAQEYGVKGEKAYLWEKDANTNELLFCKQPVIFERCSKYISKYKNITTREQYVADKLAEITNRRPYYFNKKASECWYMDCMCEGYSCYKEKVKGSKTGVYVNDSVINCNKSYLGKNKIKSLLEQSMLLVVYQCLDKLILGNEPKVNVDAFNHLTT